MDLLRAWSARLTPHRAHNPELHALRNQLTATNLRSARVRREVDQELDRLRGEDAADRRLWGNRGTGH